MKKLENGEIEFSKEEKERREIRIKLKYPINSLTEIVLKRPKAGDIWDLDLNKEPSSAEIMEIASKISGQPPDLLRLLDPADSWAILRETTNFLSCIAQDSVEITAT